MNHFISLILFLSNSLFVCLYAQSVTDDLPVNNYSIYSELANKGISKLIDWMSIEGKNKIYFIPKDTSGYEIRFLINSLKQKMPEYKIVENNIYPDSSISIKFSEIEFNTSYSNQKKSSIVKRELGRNISMKFQCKIYIRDSLVYSYYFKDYSNDKFDYEYLSYVESGDMPFFKGEIPKATFLDKYLIPAAVISASVVAVILFFVIRSK